MAALKTQGYYEWGKSREAFVADPDLNLPFENLLSLGAAGLLLEVDPDSPVRDTSRRMAGARYHAATFPGFWAGRAATCCAQR